MNRKTRKSSRKRALTRVRRYLKTNTRAERKSFLRRMINSGSVVTPKDREQQAIEAVSTKQGFLSKMSSTLRSVTRRQSSRGG